jgi:hypothetical protein
MKSSYPHKARVTPMVCLSWVSWCGRMPICPLLQVLADTKELVSSTVSGAQEMVSSSVSSAKETVATRVTGAVDVTLGAVQNSVDKTKSAMTSGVQSVMGSRVGQMVISGVDRVLVKSEAWADNRLPLTEAELGEYPYPGPSGLQPGSPPASVRMLGIPHSCP